VQVTDRLDAKVLGQDTYTAVAAAGFQTKISRVQPSTSAALQVTANTLPTNQAPPDTVRLSLGAQFNLPRGAAGDKDPGVEIGQEVTTLLTIGKPVNVIDVSTGSEGRRRFVVQVTVTRVAVE